jgi:hypothetical protein
MPSDIPISNFGSVDPHADNDPLGAEVMGGSGGVGPADLPPVDDTPDPDGSGILLGDDPDRPATIKELDELFKKVERALGREAEANRAYIRKQIEVVINAPARPWVEAGDEEDPDPNEVNARAFDELAAHGLVPGQAEMEAAYAADELYRRTSDELISRNQPPTEENIRALMKTYSDQGELAQRSKASGTTYVRQAPSDLKTVRERLEADRKSGTTKSTVQIPHALHRQLKALSSGGLSLQEQITLAIEEYLARRR